MFEKCPVGFLFAERHVLLLIVLQKQMWSLVRTKEKGVRTADSYCQVDHLALVKHHWISYFYQLVLHS